MQFHWGSGGYKALERLVLQASFKLQRATGIFTDTSRPALRYIHLRSTTFAHPHDLQALSNAISSTCDQLVYPALVLFIDSTTADTPLDLGAIRPLLKCRLLVTLYLHHSVPCSFDEGDIATMAQAWPRLRQLGLCSDPLILPHTLVGLQLTFLDQMARYFPKLTHLEIYVNGMDVPTSTDGQYAFTKLELCSFGTSPVPLAKEVVVSLY